jgi:hypothetical protein
MNVKSILPFAALLSLAIACGPITAAFAKVAQASDWLGTVVDVASAGADSYLDRHPNAEAQQAIASAIATARQAIAVLRSVANAGQASDVDSARTAALTAYRDLRALLDELGVLDASAPLGGAEDTTAPEPEPLDLPTALEAEARLAG